MIIPKPIHNILPSYRVSAVSDARMEFLIRDRLSWLRFLGFDFGKPTPDENTIRMFHKRLAKAGAIRRVFEDFDYQFRRAGCLALGGQDGGRVLA